MSEEEVSPAEEEKSETPASDDAVSVGKKDNS